MLVRSVKAFSGRLRAGCGLCRGACPLEPAKRVQAQIEEHALGPRVHVVEGGDSRQASVGNALAALESGDEDLVLVHDAVRPLIRFDDRADGSMRIEKARRCDRRFACC